MKNIKLGDAEALFKLPKIQGYRQLFDRNGCPAYRPAFPGEYFRTASELNSVGQDSVYTTSYPVFILEKEGPQKFKFGDVVSVQDTEWFVSQVTSYHLSLICSNRQLWETPGNVRLIEKANDESQAKLIALLNGEHQ